ETRERAHVVARRTALALERVPRRRERRRPRLREPHRVLADEWLVDGVGFDQRAEDAGQEGEIAAGGDVEPAVRDGGAEQRARRNGRHPVPIEPRLAERV